MRSTLAAALLLAAGHMPAVAQEPEIIEFEGVRITITEKDTGEKVLAFDGRTIATDYVVFLNRTTDVAGTPVAATPESWVALRRARPKPAPTSRASSMMRPTTSARGPRPGDGSGPVMLP